MDYWKGFCMYRIMLADDEGIVLDSLQFIIEKNFKGQFEIETAKTGRAVIELAEHFKPDIAFMDIQMPGINGIDAIREIKSTNPSTIFIVLTAYDKFMYAKEAVTLGVMEYLNKPVSQKVVVEVIEKALKQIDSRRERQRNDLIAKEKMETVIPIIESGFIYSILFQEYFDEDINNYKHLLDLEVEYGYMISVVFGEAQEGNYMTNAVGSSVKTQANYRNVWDTLKEFFPRIIVGSIMSNKIPAFIPYENKKMDYNERIELIDKCREISRRLNKETGIVFRLGIGSVKKLKDSMESYQEALKSLINSTGRVAHVDDLPLNCEYADDYPIDLEERIFEELKAGHEDTCMEACRSFFDWMNERYGENDSGVKLKALEFVLYAEQYAYRSGGMTYHFEGRQEYLAEVMGAVSNVELRKWYLDKMSAACKNVVVKKEEHNNSIVARAKEYIQQNYKKDVSLDDLSRELNLSPYYFSKLFKDETGENFIEYVTAVRMNKAKEFLRDKELSMKEICAEIGYSDPNYFSRIFKKNVGITPTEFRDEIN